MRLRSDAVAIWNAGLEAVRTERLMAGIVERLSPEALHDLELAPSIRVVGCGKAGAAMALGLEKALAPSLGKISGLVNIPEGTSVPTQRIELLAARPAGSNHPTAKAVGGAKRMLNLLENAAPDDVAFCLVSGGGSALLPAPVDGISLEDKQLLTQQLHASGATIVEMNAVRKHLSLVKGGRLAKAFRGKRLIALIISDVVGDPLDVIASGPTVADPTTFADALDVLRRYPLEKVPQSIREYLEAGHAGLHPETLKSTPSGVDNLLLGNNAHALDACEQKAKELGYEVLNLGPYVEGESREVAVALAGVARAVSQGIPRPAPLCFLVGGETTVSLGSNPGKGGRNQEFVLAFLEKLGQKAMAQVAVVSGGTDGEDGPTDAAGAIGTARTFEKASGLDFQNALRTHASYDFFAATGDLLMTGPTGTNVADLRVILCGAS